MDERQKAAFRELEKSGYLPGLRTHAMARCVPFWWSSGEAGEARILHNGTVTYVYTGTEYLGITADHVYRAYSEDRRRYEDIEAQFNGNTIYPERYLIDRKRRLDLATFRVPPIFVSSHGTVEYHKPALWPPPSLKRGELVLYGGYPELLRTTSSGKAHLPFQTFIWTVTDVAEESMAMNLAFGDLFWPGHEGEDINRDLSGISGGPVFRIFEELDHDPKRVKFELVGIVFECLESLQIARARHISHVLADGSLVSLRTHDEDSLSA